MDKYLVDVILIGIVAVSALAAARRGFLLSLLNFLASIAAIVTARICSGGVAEAVYTSLVRVRVLEKVQSFLPADLTSGDPQAILNGVLAQLPDGIAAIADKYGLLPTEVGAVDSAAAFFDINNLEARYIKPFCLTVLGLLAMVVLFYVLYTVLRIVARMIDRARHHNKKQTFNRLAGAGLGLAKGVIPVVVLAVLLNLAAVYNTNDKLTAAVENSRICALVADATDKILSSDKEA